MKGGGDVTLGGTGPLPGARKRDVKKERIAARVAKFKDPYKPTRERQNGRDVGGTTPLNAGFFKLERMRAASAARKKGAARARAKGR
ncbi:MAG: hypothetical protein VW405_17630 [Rhodospirillaceae bacterium]